MLHHPATAALAAGHGAAPFGRAAAGAVSARFVTRDSHLLLEAAVGLLEAQRQVVAQVGAVVARAALPGAPAEELREKVAHPAATTAAEELAENIRNVALVGEVVPREAAAAEVDPFVAVAVVARPLLVVGQHFVRLGDYLEFLLGLGLVFAVGVGVVFPCQCAVRFLDFRLRRIPLDTEHFVVVPLCHGGGATSRRI